MGWGEIRAAREDAVNHANPDFHLKRVQEVLYAREEEALTACDKAITGATIFLKR